MVGEERIPLGTFLPLKRIRAVAFGGLLDNAFAAGEGNGSSFRPFWCHSADYISDHAGEAVVTRATFNQKDLYQGTAILPPRHRYAVFNAYLSYQSIGTALAF
jgi:hypothetical protein